MLMGIKTNPEPAAPVNAKESRGLFRRLGRDLLLAVGLSLLVLGILLAVSSASAQSQQERARLTYVEAQKLLNEEHYSDAANAYAQVYELYGKSRYAAESLYWEAFSRYRTGSDRDLRRAADLLAQQLREFPEVARRGDTEELAIRIQQELADRGDARAAEELARLADRLREVSEDTETDHENDIDLNEETKIAALQALLQMSPERALPILRKILVDHPEKYSGEFRENALFLVSQKKSEESIDILLHVVSHDPDADVRENAVFWLGQIHDKRALDLLVGILGDPQQDDDIREKAIFSISQYGGERAGRILRELALDKSSANALREQAIFWLHQNSSAQNRRFLMDLYQSLEDDELKAKVLFSVSQTGSEQARDWLMTIVNDKNEDVELRKNALFWAGQMGGVKAADLKRIFETVDDSEMGEQVIFVLSQLNSRESVDVLIDIARNAKNKDMREKAIFWIGQSNDDRAAEFLTEIIENW